MTLLTGGKDLEHLGIRLCKRLICGEEWLPQTDEVSPSPFGLGMLGNGTSVRTGFGRLARKGLAGSAGHWDWGIRMVAKEDDRAIP